MYCSYTGMALARPDSLQKSRLCGGGRILPPSYLYDQLIFVFRGVRDWSFGSFLQDLISQATPGCVVDCLTHYWISGERPFQFEYF